MRKETEGKKRKKLIKKESKEGERVKNETEEGRKKEWREGVE